MATEVMKVELEVETCCICGGGGELLSPEEHDAGAPPMQVPLRTMLVHLNSSKVVPEGRLCGSCIRRTMESYEFSTALSARGVPPLSEKIRALRRRLHELTQKIDVFIVVGGAGAGGAYSEEDIIMVERDTLAAAAAADDEDLERARNARGESVYQCSVSGGRVPRALRRARRRPALVLDVRRPAALARRAAGARPGLRGGRPARAGRGRAAACPACGARAADRAALAAHAAARHGRGARPPHVCAVCFRTLESGELLAAHALRHRRALHYVCGYDGCILRFASRANLMAHIRKCHTADLPPAAAPRDPAAPSTACDHCGRTFGSVAAMKRHARVHRPAVQQRERVQEEGEEWAEGEDMEGEVEYLEVDELEDMQYRDTDNYDHKPDLDDMQ
ncbi:unnamed protein product [Spodoptera littoralis]|uniref:C2H2-type domain-containing protein n=1 Tax=Spodoptera littoralis TaxID=7109 RepID=A0A9P0I3W3_SPOLI|nr:unnamed protein product [Spodoptera littoralis]CAH1640892.1 unnamed protein product [Spodoptera littoralis]